MEINKSLLKEKLRLELHLLKQTPHGSIISTLQWINQLLWPEESIQPTMTKIQIELSNLTAEANHLSEEARFIKLNHYFFKKLNFHLAPDSKNPQDWLLASVFSEKKGHPLIVSLIYLVFAESLYLPFNLLNHSSYSVLKWSRPKESNIIDLTQNGIALQTQQIIDRFKEHKFATENLESLKHCHSIKLYLNALLEVLVNDSDSLQKLSLLDTLLELEPSNLNYLGQRALLYKNLNQRKEAMDDLKKYFSFVDQKAVPDFIQSAYYELCLEPTPHNLIH